MTLLLGGAEAVRHVPDQVLLRAVELLRLFHRCDHADRFHGRGLHSSTSHLNLSRFGHRNSLKPPTYPAESAHVKQDIGRV
jgi:hypothetical protein